MAEILSRQRPPLSFAGGSRTAGGSTSIWSETLPQGHVALLRAAREFGDRVTVGVLSDHAASSYKRLAIKTLAERVAVVDACRYVDEVLPNAPYKLRRSSWKSTTSPWWCNGDDTSPGHLETVFGAVPAAGKLRLVPHTAAVSTTN